MPRRHIEKESFLADLTGFLNELGSVPLCDAVVHGTTDLLADSNALLVETEALLASFGSSRASTSAATSAAESSSTAVDDRKAVQNAQAARRRLKYRTKLKTERHTLQEQEKSLTEQLGHLQHTRKKPRPLQAQNDEIPLWEAVAMGQREGRVVAEEQRRRLQAAVDSRNSVLSEIGEMMRQRYGVETPMICAGPEPETAVPLSPDDKALFEDYLHDLDVVYARTDEMFEASGVEPRPVFSYRTGPARKFEGDWEFQDSLDVLLIPFTFERTCSAMWQSMVQVHRQKDRSHYAGVVAPENTIAVKFHLC
jgi:hypothetical protein